MSKNLMSLIFLGLLVSGCDDSWAVKPYKPNIFADRWEVKSVESGNSLTVVSENNREIELELRLCGTELPNNQQLQQEAKNYLESLIKSSQNIVKINQVFQSDGRIVTDVFATDSLMLSAEMVRLGLLKAKDFERCSYQDLIVNADLEAKTNQRGLWK